MQSIFTTIRKAPSWLSRLDAPVLVQEMRVRQRGVKPFIVLSVYLMVLSAIALLTLHFSSRGDLALVGQQMFGFLSVAQLVMVILIVPAYGSASVSGERERGTFDLLALTLLPSMGIVTQKLVAAIIQALMLIVVSVPVTAIVFLVGGVSPVEVMVVYALLVVTAIMLGAFGVFCSCCLRTSRASTFLTYSASLVFFAGIPIGGEWLRGVSRYGFYNSVSAFPLAFTFGFAFVGGVLSLLVYAPVALVMSKKTDRWRTRAFRMGVFGSVYALLLLVLSVPSSSEPALNALFRQDIFLLDFVNSFAAMFMFFEASWSGYSRHNAAYWAVGATIVFSLGCAVIFRQISSARFAGLRRS